MMDTQLTMNERTALLDAVKGASFIAEWGSGGSTLMLLDSITDEQTICSIEHNPYWYAKVYEQIARHPRKSQIAYLYIPAPPNQESAYGQPQEELPYGLDAYIHPPPRVFDADVFLVDGIARGAVLASIAVNRTNKRSVVFLHDWVHRTEWYRWAVRLYSFSRVVGTTMIRMS